MCANIYIEIGNVPSYSDSISNEKKGLPNTNYKTLGKFL